MVRKSDLEDADDHREGGDLQAVGDVADRDWPAGGGAGLDWAASGAAANPDWPASDGVGCHGDP